MRNQDPSVLAVGLSYCSGVFADAEKSSIEVQIDPEVLCHSCSRGIVSSSFDYVFILSF